MDAEIRNMIERLHSTSTMAVIPVAGAGTQAISWLLSVAGASRTVLEIIVPYASSSFRDFIGREPRQIVSAQSANELARAAYERALVLRESDVAVVGVSCTATIATDRPKRGDHRCHIAVWARDGITTYSLTFVKGLRDRAGEDMIASKLVLKALSKASDVEFDLLLELDEREEVEEAEVRYADPIDALLADHVHTATIYADGRLGADEPFVGGILSGSFNPLHEGHEQLAEVASRILGAEVALELSITNVDKPRLEEAEIRRRIAQAKGRRSMVVTQALVFYQKAKLFPGSTFIIGWDTATRLVDPKYYDGQEAKMLMAFEDIRRLGCRFLVAGRAVDGEFQTLDNVLVPPVFQEMFTAIPESAFRNDVSSTDLREASV